MHCGEHVVCGIPTWLFGTTEKLMMGKSKGWKTPNPSKRRRVHIKSPHGSNLLWQLPTQQWRGTWHTTQTVKQRASHGCMWKVAQWCWGLTNWMGSWTAESGMEMKVEVIICKGGRCDIVWQTCRVRVYSHRRKKRHFEKSATGDLGIWNLGNSNLKGCPRLLASINLTTPTVKFQDTCKHNTGYLLSTRLPGALFLEVQNSQTVGLCCAGDVQNRDRMQGLELHNPCLTPCNICWLLFRYDDCSSDAHLTQRSKHGR